MNRDVKIQPTLAGEIKTVLINYLKTQFVLMLIVTALVWGVLSLIGVKYAAILAFGTGALSAAPFFGMTIASIIAGLVAIFDRTVFLPGSPTYVEGLVILLVFFVLNLFVDFLLTPLFLGRTNKINPVILVLVVFLGTAFFGVAGAFLAIPTLLVIKTAWKYFKNKV